MANPTFVFVPGSFAAPFIYKGLVERLRAKGYPALETILPSTMKRPGLEPATMHEDAKHVRALVEALTGQGKEVVVVCHSYGGAPTTEGLVGVPVKRIVYMTAVVPKVGETFDQALPMVETMINGAVGGYMHSDPAFRASTIGNDFASWEFAYECALQLPHHSAISFKGKVTQAAYEKAPVTYLFTEKDLIVTPEDQEKYIKVIEEAQGKKIDVIRKPWGHCPNWSQPDELVETLIGVAEK